jgi:hypothetical protein
MGARHESGVRGVFGVARAYPVRQTRPQDEILPYIAASRKRWWRISKAGAGGLTIRRRLKTCPTNARRM